MTMLDTLGRKIPAPPVRRFSPTNRRSTQARPAGRITWEGDTRHTVGNITARTNRRPLTAADIRALMAAPAGR